MDYGLNNALIGEERFWALYKTHTVAKEKGWKVSYKGITQIELDIPSNAKTIPLSYKTDFCKASIIVTNTKKKNFFLFELSQEVYPISVPKNLFGTYDFRGIEELKRGNRLLIIEDLNPWVENRAGYNYGAIRRDILLLKDGKSINMTVAPYNNATSIPKCSYTTVSRKRKDIKSIVFIRTSESSFKTFLMRVMNVDNVLIQGVSIVTSKPITMDGDRAIAVENCTNVVFKNINMTKPILMTIIMVMAF